jgi:hypothetical protein
MQFTFTKPATETELQDRVYNSVMELLAGFIADAKDDDDRKRRALVIKRRCTAQSYSQNHDALVDFAAHIIANREAENAAKAQNKGKTNA